jgi:hypothetical protein
VPDDRPENNTPVSAEESHAVDIIGRRAQPSATPFDPAQNPAYGTNEFLNLQDRLVEQADELEEVVRRSDRPDTDNGRMRRLHNAKSREWAREGGMAFPPFAEEDPSHSPYFFPVVPPAGTSFASTEDAMLARATHLDLREVGLQHQSEMYFKRMLIQNDVHDAQEALEHELAEEKQQVLTLRQKPLEDLQFREGCLSVQREHAAATDKMLAARGKALDAKEALRLEKELWITTQQGNLAAKENALNRREDLLAASEKSVREREALMRERDNAVPQNIQHPEINSPESSPMVHQVAHEDQSSSESGGGSSASAEDQEYMNHRLHSANVVAASRRLEDSEYQAQQAREHLSLAIAASKEADKTSRKRQREDEQRDQLNNQEDFDRGIARTNALLEAHARRIREQAMRGKEQRKEQRDNDNSKGGGSDDDED